MIFFLLWIFSKFSLLILLFLILSWLRITTVDFLMKYYRLLQCSLYGFFPLVFFVMIVSKIVFVYFIFLNIKLVKNLNFIIFFENIMDCNRFSLYIFFYYFFHKLTTIHKHTTSGRYYNSKVESCAANFVLVKLRKRMNFLKLLIRSVSTRGYRGR